MIKKLIACFWLLGAVLSTEVMGQTICPDLTKSKVANLKDEDLELATFECAAKKIGKDYQHAYQIITAQPRFLQIAYITWQLEAEVNNGGFNQYFWNSSGEFADLAPDAFKEIGAMDHAALVSRAVKVAISDLPKMRKYRQEGTLDAFSASYKETSLGPLDHEFYKLTENVSKLRSSYLRKQLAALSK